MKVDKNKIVSDTSKYFPIFIDLFQYSIKDINSYEELTDTEKKIINKEIFNSITK